MGVDPGLAGTGVGIVYGCGQRVEGYSFGSVETLKKDSTQDRLDQIYTRLKKVIDSQKPDLLVIEKVFFLPKYPNAALSLGMVSGVVYLAAGRTGVPIKGMSVRETKQILTGNGNADKAQLEHAVRHVLKHPVPIKPYHSSDALALALIGLYRFHSLMGN